MTDAAENAPGANAAITLKSHRFRTEREADWQALEALLDRVERRGARALSDAEMIGLPNLYRSALSSLSVARAISLDQGVIHYLEGLCARAYFFVYGARTTPLERVRRFFTEDWPRAARALGRETIIAAAIMFAGALAAWLLLGQDMDWYASIIPEGLAGGRTPDASTESLEATLGHDGDTQGLSFFATFLFTHNARIALFAFALGFAFGVPTAFLLAYNGMVLGAFVALFASRDLGVEVGGWLLIHGVTELWAVILAGAAGLHIGKALAFPGGLSRSAAARAAGKSAALVMIGVIIMLFIAGLLEAFGRQLIESTAARYAIAATTAVIWGAYLYLPRRSDTAPPTSPPGSPSGAP